MADLPKLLNDLIGEDEPEFYEYKHGGDVEIEGAKYRNTLRASQRQKLPQLVKALEDALIEAEQIGKAKLAKYILLTDYTLSAKQKALLQSFVDYFQEQLKKGKNANR